MFFLVVDVDGHDFVFDVSRGPGAKHGVVARFLFVEGTVVSKVGGRGVEREIVVARVQWSSRVAHCVGWF